MRSWMKEMISLYLAAALAVSSCPAGIRAEGPRREELETLSYGTVSSEEMILPSAQVRTGEEAVTPGDARPAGGPEPSGEPRPADGSARPEETFFVDEPEPSVETESVGEPMAGESMAEEESLPEEEGIAEEESLPEEEGIAEEESLPEEESMPEEEMLPSAEIQPGVIAGKYRFTSAKDANRQIVDSFVWRDECFLRPSSLGCNHLAVLSAQTAMASASWYGLGIDRYEKDYSDNSHNLRQMLQAMGFEDYAENGWYSREKKENTMGAAIARKKLAAEDGDYTLLAIVPRSAGYKLEWAGDFMIGAGDIHEGFLLARDEVLRLTRNYIRENNITGPLKVWTMGHSRGAAVANLVAAFFIGGGIGYFGDQVSITPEDVYCYGFATIRMVKAGAAKSEELSVGAARGGSYAYDTPGEGYVSEQEGTLDPQAEIYAGIRNYSSAYDVFTLLPPAAWGFTCFGNYCPLDGGGLATYGDMLDELKELSPGKYKAAVEAGNPADSDPAGVNADTSPGGPAPDGGSGGLLDSFVEGFTHGIPSNEAYADGPYQEALQAAAALYGLLMNNVEGVMADSMLLIANSLVDTYLAYVSERLIAEGRAKDEADAIALALADLLEYASGEKVDYRELTVDDCFRILAESAVSDENTGISGVIVDAAERFLYGQTGSFVLRTILGAFTPAGKLAETGPGELFRNFFYACAYGPKAETPAAKLYKDAPAVRRYVYSLSYLLLTLFSPELVDAVGRNEEGKLDGSAAFTEFIRICCRDALTEKKTGEKSASVYPSFGDAADSRLAAGLDEILGRAIAQTEGLYGKEYHDTAERYLKILEKNVTYVRKMLSYALLYTEGEGYSTKSAVRKANAFLKNRGWILLTHTYEIYLAWVRALDKAEEGH